MERNYCKVHTGKDRFPDLFESVDLIQPLYFIYGKSDILYLAKDMEVLLLKPECEHFLALVHIPF